MTDKYDNFSWILYRSFYHSLGGYWKVWTSLYNFILFCNEHSFGKSKPIEMINFHKEKASIRAV